MKQLISRKGMRGRSESGGVAIIFAVAVPVLAAGAFGAMDVMQMLNVGSALQDAADGAALAAVKVAVAGATDAQAREHAGSVVAADFAAVTLGADRPSFTAAIDRSKDTKATVTTASHVNLFFTSLVGFGSQTLSRTATAQSLPGQPICLLILSPSADDAWSMAGTSDVRGSNCVSQVNSTSARALSRNGNASATMESVYVAGPPDAGHGQGFRPTPQYGMPALPDPYASKVSWPAARSCDHQGIDVNKDQTLSPGTYCDGLTIKGATATLQPGVYVIQDGDVSVTSHGLLNAPSGVTLVLTGADSQILVQSQGDVNLSAPTSGPWANIAIAIKPQATERTSTLIGGGSITVDGMIYAPTQQLHLTGGGTSSSAPRRILVVNTLHTSGNGQIDLSGDADILAQPSRVRLIK